MHVHTTSLSWWAVLLTIPHGLDVVIGQVILPQVSSQNNTFNSTATISEVQIELGGIDPATASNIAVALNFERSNWAYGSVSDDDFYRVPKDSFNASAGSLLKVELYTNTTSYTIPPNTALSRIMYQTKNLNGTATPASAFILWPYMPRSQLDGYPIVAWAHGTSGLFGECAPSHLRNLLYQFAAPFTLALQGYVVVAPDYAGLGVDTDASGKPIPHQYAANPAAANDLFYAVQAAQSTFDSLSRQFVIMGHSQGGGAAWGAAQRQIDEPVDGYLGTIAGSPLTDSFALFDLISLALVASLQSVFGADFDPTSFVTDAGEKRLALLKDIQGCDPVQSQLFADGLVQAGFQSTFYAKAYQQLTSNGGRKIAGPMLVLQGEADTTVPFAVTATAINETCEMFPESQLEFVTFANVSHVPVLYAGQRVWLKWIEDRFAGVPVKKVCQVQGFESALEYQRYQVETNWFLEFATQGYEVT